MNSIELFHKDGKATGVFYCTHCRRVSPDKERADKCCAPTLCRHCGKESGRENYTACDSCEKALDIKKEADRFNAAAKVSEWNGWLFIEGLGCRGGFFESVADLMDWIDDEEANCPEYAWTCSPNHFATGDASDILERIEGEGYEGFEIESLNGINELKAAIAKFNEANAAVCSYEPDYTTAFLIPKK